MNVFRSTLAAVVVSLLTSLAIAPPAARADENLFGYVYGAETLPQGKWEAYQWITLRSGKGDGSYRAFDLRTEIETGLTDKLQAAFYVNTRSHAIDGVPGLEDRSGFAFQGVSAELKYRLKSPYLDGWGFALYAEPGYSRVDKISGEIEEELELELKAIFQKNFVDDTVVWSLNYTLEPEWAIGDEEDGHEEMPGEEHEHEEARKELIEELTTGVSVRFAPRWFLGAELRVHSEWPDFSRREHLAAFLGPSLHYGGERYWWTLSVMPQIWGWPSEEVSHLHFDEHEQLELRLKFGYNFR
ncbi:MAG: DUF6662 family protein [Thermoanaerobaculia bacterium]